MKNLPALYQIANEYQEAATRLAELDLPEEVVRDTLEGLSGDLEAKSTNVAAFVRNLEAMAEKMKEAENEIAQRRAAIEKRTERVRQYLKENMERTGITKIECPYFALTIQKNPPGVKVIDAGAVPDAYMRIPPVPAPEPDKSKIKKALQEGVDVPGCELTQGTRLAIK
jgi:uncharacterized coiled-coil protein SlyX